MPKKAEIHINRVEYKCLESRIFDAFYRNAVSETEVEKIFGQGEYLNLCRFTRNIYSLLREKPELLAKTLNEDDAHPHWFNASAYGKPALKKNMRKAFKAVSDFMWFLWKKAADENKNPPSKYKNLLGEIEILPGIFTTALKLRETNFGFERFIRCAYDDFTSCKTVFGPMFNNAKLLNHFIGEIEKRGYTYKVNLNSAEVKNFEGVNAFWLKSINGTEPPKNLSMYEHDHFGIQIIFSALLADQALIFLHVQNVRKVCALFDTLDEKLRDFIIKHHAKCDNCGYCTQRNKNRAATVKPYTVSVAHKGKAYGLCPINHVYSYCWNYTDAELIEGMLMYLELQEEIHGV